MLVGCTPSNCPILLPILALQEMLQEPPGHISALDMNGKGGLLALEGLGSKAMSGWRLLPLTVACPRCTLTCPLGETTCLGW